MRHLVTAVVVCLVGIGVPWAAAAEDCQYQVIKLNLADRDLPEPPPGWDYCESYPIRGTLTGQWTTCIKWVDFFWSDDIWGDGVSDKWVFKNFDWFETSDGELLMDRWHMFHVGEPHMEKLLQVGLSEITGGTQAFEGATGVLVIAPNLPNRNDVVVFQGHICTP